MGPVTMSLRKVIPAARSRGDLTSDVTDDEVDTVSSSPGRAAARRAWGCPPELDYCC
jgi:hypothetical protein